MFVVKTFLDSSVLVAAFYDNHENHVRSFDLFARQTKSTGCTAAHCLAEVYSSLTGVPGRDRATPDEALSFLDELRGRLMLVTLGPEEVVDVIEQGAAAGLTGGSIYDALIGRCAMKAKAEVIYTWNTKHFIRLSPQIAARIRTP